jgi:hypothetical protein
MLVTRTLGLLAGRPLEHRREERLAVKAIRIPG